MKQAAKGRHVREWRSLPGRVEQRPVRVCTFVKRSNGLGRQPNNRAHDIYRWPSNALLASASLAGSLLAPGRNQMKTSHLRRFNDRAPFAQKGVTLH